MILLRLPQMSTRFFHSRDLDDLRDALSEEGRQSAPRKQALRVVSGKDVRSD